MFPFYLLCLSYEDPDKCLILYGDDQVAVRVEGQQETLSQGPGTICHPFKEKRGGGGVHLCLKAETK